MPLVLRFLRVSAPSPCDLCHAMTVSLRLFVFIAMPIEWRHSLINVGGTRYWIAGCRKSAQFQDLEATSHDPHKTGMGGLDPEPGSRGMVPLDGNPVPVECSSPVPQMNRRNAPHSRRHHGGLAMEPDDRHGVSRGRDE